jgi:hypothetical protein
MATITITYTAPVAPVDGVVAPISATYFPTNSYVDSEPYAGTIWDTNVEGFGTWEGLVNYLSKVTAHPGYAIMFKAAMRDGSATVTETDEKVIEYYKELGVSLADQGFTVEVGDGESEEASA